MHAKHLAIHHFRAGCYDEIIPARRLSGCLYYVEFFAVDAGGSRAASASYFGGRQKKHTDARLAMVMERIGLLAPDPGGMAIWEVSSYAALDGLMRDVGESVGIWPVTAGIYRDFAEEIL